MAVSFLFWNANKHDLKHLLVPLVQEHAVDFAILAESEKIEPAQVVAALNAENENFRYHFAPSNRIRMYSRLPIDSVAPLHDAGGVSIRRLKHPLHAELILVGVHLSSKSGKF